jgi:uncharacterized membrane protein
MLLAFINSIFLVLLAFLFKLVYLHQYNRTDINRKLSSFEIQFFKCTFEMLIIGVALIALKGKLKIEFGTD